VTSGVATPITGTPDALHTATVAASPERVWALVGDPRRTPEWSPVCHRIDWVGPAPQPEAGARFVGHNKLNGFRWKRECRIGTYEAPTEIAYSTFIKGDEATRWRYRLTPTDDGGTEVEEAYQVVSVPRWVRVLRKLPGAMEKTERDVEHNISSSLSRIKELVEGEG
jgi:uncharacterized protein YndB with AHSA1/START domain